MDSESGDSQCLSLPTTPSGNLPTRSRESPAQSAESAGSTVATAREEAPRLLGERGAPQLDNRKDKAQKSWLRSLLTLALRSAPEEPKEKAGRKVKGREGLPSPVESPEGPELPLPRKKAQDKKTGRRRAEARETRSTREQETRVFEAGPPKKASTGCSEEALQGPTRRGREHSGHHQSRHHQPEDELRKPDKDAVIQTIVEFLKKVAEVCEKQNAAGNADVTCPESQPPQRPTSLALPNGSHRPSTPRSSGLGETRAPETLCPERGDLSPVNVCHKRAKRRAPEEEVARDRGSESKEAVIQMIVEFLQRVGDQYEIEQLQVPQPEAFGPNLAPPSKKKPAEKKTSLKRVFSLKKQGAEEPKRAAGAAGPEFRPSRGPTFLAMCVGGHRASIPSSSGLEEAEVTGTLSPEGGDLSPVDVGPGRAAPGEDSAQDRVSESKEAVIQMIVEFLQRVGDQYEIEQLQVPQPESFGPNLAPPSKKKPAEKKTSLKRVFSLKKQGAQEPKRAAGAASPEFRPSRGPTFLAMCVGGHRASIPSSVDLDAPEYQESSPTEGGQEGPPKTAPQARSHKPERKPLLEEASESKLLIIQKLEAFLQEVGNQLGEQIRQHPCLKRYFQELLDSCQARLMTALRSQEAHSLHPNRSPAKGPYQFPFDLPNKFAGNSHNVISLLDLLGHYRRRRESSSQFYGGAQQDITSPDIQIESPD